MKEDIASPGSLGNAQREFVPDPPGAGTVHSPIFASPYAHPNRAENMKLLTKQGQNCPISTHESCKTKPIGGYAKGLNWFYYRVLCWGCPMNHRENKANSTMNLIQHIATPVRNRLARKRPRTQHAKQSQFQSGQSCLIENLVAPYRGRKSRWPITQNKANLSREEITISVPSTEVYRLLPSAGGKENKANDKLGNIQCPSTYLPVSSPSAGLWPGELSLDVAVGFIYATDRFSRPQVWQGGILEA